jgi:hypothetical protein
MGSDEFRAVGYANTGLFSTKKVSELVMRIVEAHVESHVEEWNLDRTMERAIEQVVMTERVAERLREAVSELRQVVEGETIDVREHRMCSVLDELERSAISDGWMKTPVMHAEVAKLKALLNAAVRQRDGAQQRGVEAKRRLDLVVKAVHLRELEGLMTGWDSLVGDVDHLMAMPEYEVRALAHSPEEMKTTPGFLDAPTSHACYAGSAGFEVMPWARNECAACTGPKPGRYTGITRLLSGVALLLADGKEVSVFVRGTGRNYVEGSEKPLETQFGFRRIGEWEDCGRADGWRAAIEKLPDAKTTTTTTTAFGQDPEWYHRCLRCCTRMATHEAGRDITWGLLCDECLAKDSDHGPYVPPYGRCLAGCRIHDANEHLVVVDEP